MSNLLSLFLVLMTHEAKAADHQVVCCYEAAHASIRSGRILAIPANVLRAYIIVGLALLRLTILTLRWMIFASSTGSSGIAESAHKWIASRDLSAEELYERACITRRRASMSRDKASRTSLKRAATLIERAAHAKERMGANTRAITILNR